MNEINIFWICRLLHKIYILVLEKTKSEQKKNNNKYLAYSLVKAKYIL